eukprot:scaffold21315_cov48-Attheya_sp.AAC.2
MAAYTSSVITHESNHDINGTRHPGIRQPPMPQEWNLPAQIGSLFCVGFVPVGCRGPRFSDAVPSFRHFLRLPLVWRSNKLRDPN